MNAAFLENTNKEYLSQANHQSVSSEQNNKYLWLKALENNGLFSALDAFSAVNGKQVLIGDVNQGSLLAKAEGNQLQLNFPSKIKAEGLAKVLNSQNEGLRVNTQQKVASAAYKNIQNSHYLEASVVQYERLNSLSSKINKNTQNTQMFKANWTHQEWLSKNTTVTIAHSALEVWVRDASHPSTEKLLRALEYIQQSMAKLGVSLSKVVVNGKVVLDRQTNHHQEGN